MKISHLLSFSTLLILSLTGSSQAQDANAFEAARAQITAARNLTDAAVLQRSLAPSLLAVGPGRFGIDPVAAKAMNDSNQKIAEAIKGIKDAESDSEKQQFKTTIKEELATQYDAYLAQHEKPLQQLEARLEKLRKEFEVRKQAKDDLVKLRLDTIWYDALGIGWPNRSGWATRSNPLFGNWPTRVPSANIAVPGQNVAAPTFPSSPTLPARIPVLGTGR